MATTIVEFINYDSPTGVNSYAITYNSVETFEDKLLSIFGEDEVDYYIVDSDFERRYDAWVSNYSSGHQYELKLTHAKESL